MTHTEIYRRAGLNEFELTRFIAYLLQNFKNGVTKIKLKKAETENRCLMALLASREI